MLDPRYLSEWASLLGVSPGIVVVGWFLWRELRRMHEQTVAELRRLTRAIEEHYCR